MFETRFFVNGAGKYLGGYAGPDPAPINGIEVPYPPANASDIWDFEGKTWVAASSPPNIPGFFNDLVKAILAGIIPPDVHPKAKMVQDLLEPADQAAALNLLSSDPIYTADQKKALDALVVANNLAIPTIYPQEVKE